MRLKWLSFCYVVGAASIMSPLPAASQTVPTLPEGEAVVAPAAEKGRFAVDLGVGAAPDYEGSDDYRIVPLWHFRAQDLYGPTTYVDMFGPLLTSNLVPHPNLRLGPMLQYIPKRGSVDDNAVDNMENVDPALMLGVTGGWDFLTGPERNLGVFGEVRADVANGHGWLVTPGVRGRQTLAPGWDLGGTLSTTWANESYMSDYFAVDSTDARRSGLDQHDAEAGFKDVALSGALNYNFAKRFQVGLVARYARLLDDAADSTIVDDQGSANQFFGGLLAGVRF